MIPVKSIPIYKRFANHSRSSGCRKIPCVSFGQQPSSLEYKLQNAWIERLARGWPKFSTTRKRSCGIYRGCGNERGLWRCPGRHEVLDRHCVVRWKKKSSLYIQILSRASNEIYLASLLAMEHLSTTLFTLFTLLSNEFYPFDERIQTERLLRDPSMNRFAVCLGWDRLCLLHFSYLARARLEY